MSQSLINIIKQWFLTSLLTNIQCTAVYFLRVPGIVDIQILHIQILIFSAFMYGFSWSIGVERTLSINLVKRKFPSHIRNSYKTTKRKKNNKNYKPCVIYSSMFSEEEIESLATISIHYNCKRESINPKLIRT